MLTHQAPSNLYAPDRMADLESGLIFNGKDGHLLLDIPLYSARAFVHRAILKGDDTSVTVEKWETEPAGLKNLRLRTGPGFPQHASEIHAVLGGKLYQLALHDGVLEWDHQPEKNLTDYLSREQLNIAGYSNISSSSSAVQTADSLRVLLPVLTARALNHPGVFPTDISAPKNRADLQLLVVAPGPASFQLQGNGFTREDGWVLYVQDVYKP
jgi:hypothetical protein